MLGSLIISDTVVACPTQLHANTNTVTTDEKIESALVEEAQSLKCLSRKSAAELLDCHISYIDKLLASGKLKSRKLGPHITRIPMSSIKQFLSGAPAR